MSSRHDPKLGTDEEDSYVVEAICRNYGCRNPYDCRECAGERTEQRKVSFRTSLLFPPVLFDVGVVRTKTGLPGDFTNRYPDGKAHFLEEGILQIV
jgi:hypothetical protein